MPGFEPLVAGMGDRVAGVFTRAAAHAPLEVLMELIGVVRETEPDVLIGVGGGSPIDSVKLAALGVAEGVTTEEELASYAIEIDEEAGGTRVKPITGTLLPVIAVPTTLSAAEWDGLAGATDHARDLKHVMGSLGMTPKTVVLDPAFVAATPRGLWAETGVRAIDHAVEIGYARNAHPFTTALAHGALGLLAANLPRSVQDPSDHEAALNCQIAAWLSIVGVHNVSLGLSHAIGHQLGALGIPHGATSCIMLPHVMRFLEPVTRDEQAAMAATLAAAQGGGDGGNGSAADRLEALLDQLGVPRRVTDFGIPREKLPGVARAALGDFVVKSSPREVDERAINELLEAVW